MKQPKKGQLRVQAQLDAEKKIAKSAWPLSKAIAREMRDRDPHYDRLDSGIFRKN